MSNSVAENLAQQVAEFKHKVDTKHPALTALYRRKKIGLFYAVFVDLEKDMEMGINVHAYVRAIYDTLAEGRRYFDVASLYKRLHDETQDISCLLRISKQWFLRILTHFFFNLLPIVHLS